MVLFLYVLALLTAAQHGRADLPIHALVGDIAGKWRFHRTKPVDGLDVTCGSSMPNTVGGNLMLGNYMEYLQNNYAMEGHYDYELTLELTAYFDLSNKRSRQEWRCLAVKDADGRIVGRWTAIYDQGFEVILRDGTRYFFYMHYTKLDNDKYETDVNSTQIGWVYTTEDLNGAKRRCVYGYKRDGKQRGAAAVVKLYSNEVKDKYQRLERVIKDGKYDIVSSSQGQIGPKKGPYPCDCSHMDKVKFYNEVPETFQWRTKTTISVENQKRCGNCYAIAARFVLQIRFIIALERMEHLTPELQMAMDELGHNALDNSDGTQCDIFNQGCKGGYPYLTGKRMRELGIITSNYANKHCSILSEQRRYFAKDYGYVSGCYQCTACQGEDLIMREIFANGPVVSAIDASVLTDDYEGEIITVGDASTNAGICDVKGHAVLSGWEYTSHAVAIVGWGETTVDEKAIKYWVCRNSWGPDWGENGYFKIERGKNAFGIESEAVFIDPDISVFTQRPNGPFQRDVRYHRVY